MKRNGIKLLVGGVVFLLTSFTPAQAQFATRDKRWPTRGPWMWALPRQLPKLYREFNGIDFGHAHIGETLLRTRDQAEVERARLEVLDFIFSAPKVPPDEEQAAPTLVRLAWEVQRTFNWTHSFHRSLYDLFAADEVLDKETAYRKILADYLSKPEALTFHSLDHHGKLWSWPESKAFRDKFPKFNTQIWAYHWLQAAAYDVQLMGPAAQQRKLMPNIIEHYHGYLHTPPEEWQTMPMMMEVAPEFTMKFEEAAHIFDNLHMLHDNLDDVLSRPDLYPTHQARREQLMKILDIYLHRNHAGHDHYAAYHDPMHAEEIAQKQGPAHGGPGAQRQSQHQHGAQSSSDEHGERAHGSKKPEHAQWQMRQMQKSGATHQSGRHDTKPVAGMQHHQGMQGARPGMEHMGPRPPSARDVLESRLGGKHTDSGGKKEKGQERDPAGSPDPKLHRERGHSVKLTETQDVPDLANRHGSSKTAINAQNVRALQLVWKLPVEHFVTHTPLLYGGRIYFTDWAGHAYAADAATGRVLWKKKLYEPEMKWAWHGLAGTGVIAEGLLIEASVEGDAFALDLKSGEVKWKTDFAPEHEYAGSFNKLLFHDGLVYIGVSSVEEHITEERPKYRPTFRGKIVALNARTGKITWQRELVDKPSNGVAVWSAFALDTESGMLFATTGNNYTGEPSKYSDALLALDAKSGEIRWAKQILERDVWTPAEPIGPDFDFAGGPQLFEASIHGSTHKLVGASQKSGIYWAFDRTNGEVVWRATVSYGGVTGGMHSDASVGDGVIYCWGNNSFDHGIDPTESAMNVAALDAATGKIIWKKNKSQQSALTTAGFLSQDVYLVPSLDGKIHGYRLGDGEMIWHSPEVPGPISSSIAVVGNLLLATSGMPKMFSYFEGESGVYAFSFGPGEDSPAAKDTKDHQH